ncbi:DUF7096 domain-containing protein [Haloplanus halobius]|uniref:DUF7096 domain-containing protein n=1 Tax=Haloplanus halobius TaxID=2934938 RepID=UPI00201092C1|nr:hypothetical protein [Haloplanus sp. XH21]
MRALPVIVATLLLLSAAVVGPVGGLPVDRGTSPQAVTEPSDAVAQTEGNRTPLQQINVLGVPSESVDRSSVDEQYVDLGSGVGLSADATTERLRTLAMVERIEAANTTDMRRARLQTALRDLEAAVDDLDQQQIRAIRAYNRGEHTEKELLVSLVRIRNTADELGERRSRLEQLAAETPRFEIDRGRLASIGNRLSAFTGPVRAHAASVLRGEAGPHRFYLATGPQSVTLTTIVDDAYLREAYRGDLRNGAGDPIELETALDIVATSYPVIWNTTREQTQVFGGGETYPVRIAHGRGDLTAFVDSNARVVYAEHQRRPLDTMVVDRRVERSNGDLHLTVNHTYPGGPVQAQVDTDSPSDVSISMTAGPGAATPIGTTGDDGTLWTLSPNRQYTITAADGDRNVSAVVPVGTPPLVVAPERNASDSTPTPTPEG